MRLILTLHEQEVIRLNKGLAVFRPTMTIPLEEVEEKDGAPQAQALVSQQGVFSKQDIEYATLVFLLRECSSMTPSTERLTCISGNLPDATNIT